MRPFLMGIVDTGELGNYDYLHRKAMQKWQIKIGIMG